MLMEKGRNGIFSCFVHVCAYMFFVYLYTLPSVCEYESVYVRLVARMVVHECLPY